MAGRFPRTPPHPHGRPAAPPAPAPHALPPLPPGTDLVLTLGPLRRGPADPAYRAARDGSFWRASRTPEGPGTLRVTARDGTAEAHAWGEGATWLLDRLPALLGAEDDPTAFAPRHRLLAAAHRRRSRPPPPADRTGPESLIPSILEQKVTTDEAYRAWRLLVRKYGEPAPGPAPDGMHVMPDARAWSLIPSWEWHRAGVDDKRAATILRVCRVARRMEEAAEMDPAGARGRLELIPGVGPGRAPRWSSAPTAPPTRSPPATTTCPASSAGPSRATARPTTRPCSTSWPPTRASATGPPA